MNSNETFSVLGTLANSEDLDEMQHIAAFHEGRHCLLGSKQFLGTEKCIVIKKF